jgi:hypothetical protein
MDEPKHVNAALFMPLMEGPVLAEFATVVEAVAEQELLPLVTVTVNT